MADAVAEEPAVKLEFQNFGSSGEGVLDGRIGRGATPGGDTKDRVHACGESGSAR